MLITRFRAVRAHGYLDLDITFKPQLTLITGINGSGKTTVVRGIVALLTPSFRALANTTYAEMRVDFSLDSRKHHVLAIRTDTDFTLSASACEEQLSIPIYKQADFEPPSRFLERENEFYRDQHALNATSPVLQFLSEAPTPMFLDLERRGGDASRKARFFQYGDPERIARNPFGGTLGHSLAEAQELAEIAFRQASAARAELLSQLRKDLILSAFTFPASTRTKGAHRRIRLPRPGYVQRLETNQALVTQTLRTLGIEERDIQRKVTSFFGKLRTLADALPRGDASNFLQQASAKELDLLTQWIAIQPLVQQINRIVRLAARYSVASEEAYYDVNRYLNSINAFLLDSGKELVASRIGRLSVRIGKGHTTDISALSSGERQLVVILTHLAFNPLARKANVLIIDEPELSLHIHWQEVFIDALREANADLQLILATHSPSIIMDRVEECVNLSAIPTE